MLLPETGLEGTRHAAERICAANAATTMRAEDADITVTVSGGCAIGPAADSDVLLSIADTRMYQAKQSGRNRIVAAHGVINESFLLKGGCDDR